jgi:tRNA (adenine22-N1)-methyltransferase
MLKDNRMKEIYSLVRTMTDRGACDVGTDHAHIPIELVQTGKLPFAIATDISLPSAKKGEKNIAENGLSDKIKTYCANGTLGVPLDGIGDIIIAGMGGELIAQILKACFWVADPKYTLILQPQSSGNDLRRQLGEIGFRIEEEGLVEDGGFLYQVLCVRYGDPETLTPGQQYVSPALLRSGDPLLPAYFERILQALAKTVEGISRAETPRPHLAYYQTALEQVREMRDNYGNRTDRL